MILSLAVFSQPQWWLMVGTEVLQQSPPYLYFILPIIFFIMDIFLCNSFLILVHCIVLNFNVSIYSIIDVKLQEPLYGSRYFTIPAVLYLSTSNRRSDWVISCQLIKLHFTESLWAGLKNWPHFPASIQKRSFYLWNDILLSLFQRFLQP